MMSTPAALERKNIRLPAHFYIGQRLYFITLCFHRRRPFGANAQIARWLVAKLQKHADSCEFFVHAYCLMPDHLHLLTAGASEASNLMKLVESFKQDTGVQFMRRSGRPLWQFKYYDHIVRGSDSADGVAWYIWLNPVRKNLCRSVHDYPFLGSFTRMGKDLLRRSVANEWTPPWKPAALKSAALH